MQARSGHATAVCDTELFMKPPTLTLIAFVAGCTVGATARHPMTDSQRHWLSLGIVLAVLALILWWTGLAHAQATPGTLYFRPLNGTPEWCSFTGVVKCPADTTPTPYPPPTGTRTTAPPPTV